MLAAVAAPVGHRLLVFDGSDIEASAVAAMRFAAPAVVLEVGNRSFLIREALEELVEADRLRLVLLAAHET